MYFLPFVLFHNSKIYHHQVVDKWENQRRIVVWRFSIYQQPNPFRLLESWENQRRFCGLVFFHISTTMSMSAPAPMCDTGFQSVHQHLCDRYGKEGHLLQDVKVGFQLHRRCFVVLHFSLQSTMDVCYLCHHSNLVGCLCFNYRHCATQ